MSDSKYFDDHIIVAGGTPEENSKIKEALKKKYLEHCGVDVDCEGKDSK